jgi:hypothetical protein
MTSSHAARASLPTARHPSVYLTGGHAVAGDVTGAVAAGLL